MADPDPTTDPPQNHDEWLNTARAYLDDNAASEINAFFQAMHYDTGLTFVLSDQHDPSDVAIDQQYELLAAHLNALAAATSTTVEDVAADAIKTSRDLSQDGVWSDLAVTQTEPGEPAVCLACGRPNGSDRADTSFEQVDENAWECQACNSTTTVAPE